MKSTPAGVITLLVLCASWICGLRLHRELRDSFLAMPLESIRTSVGGWIGSPDAGPDPEILERLKSTSNLSRIYRSGGRAIGLFIAFYANQRAGQSMHSPKACLPGHGWVIWENEIVGLNTPAGVVHVNKYLVDDHSHRLRVLYWYQSRRRIVAGELCDKWFLVGDSLAGRDTGESLVRLIAEDGPETESDLTRFATVIVPEVGRCLGAGPSHI